jgi:hypothetical protein
MDGTPSRAGPGGTGSGPPKANQPRAVARGPPEGESCVAGCLSRPVSTPAGCCARLPDRRCVTVQARTATSSPQLASERERRIKPLRSSRTRSIKATRRASP